MIKNNRKKSSDKFWQFKNNAYLCIAIAKKQVAQRENSSVGRAQPCQGWGRGFESRFSLYFRQYKLYVIEHVRVVELVDTLL